MISKIVLNAVLKRLTDATTIPGVEKNSIAILPDGNVPAIAGQTFITVSPQELITVNQKDFVKMRQLVFDVFIIERIRDLPYDRRGEIYVNSTALTEQHETIIGLIESFAMLQILITAFKPDYSVTRNFSHRITSLNPIHLYSSFFGSKDTSDDKIAGYKTYSRFSSPMLIQNVNPLNC